MNDIHYTIIFSRRRTISITINPDKGVVVRAPYRTHVKTIDRFVNKKSDWIIKTLDSFNSLIRIDNSTGYSDGDSILLFGRDHKLKMIPSDKCSIRLVNDDIIEAEFTNGKNQLKINYLLEHLFKKIAQNRLPVKFREILLRYKGYRFSPADFVVRTMKKRWGSCSSKGKIAISYDLIRLDEKFSEYVIIHELCHLKHHDHSANFYNLLSEIYPDWKRVRKELKEYIR